MINPHLTVDYLRFVHRREEERLQKGMVSIRGDGLTGMPLRVRLDATYTAILVVPTGSADSWQSAPADELVTHGGFDCGFLVSPRPSVAVSSETRVVEERLEPSARVIVTRGRTRIGSVPLRVGLRSRFPAAGSAEIEVEIVDFRIEAGSVRGAPALGTFLSLAWRRMTADAVMPPSPMITDTVRALASRQQASKEETGASTAILDISSIYRSVKDV
jgi:hypothetical protein